MTQQLPEEYSVSEYLMGQANLLLSFGFSRLSREDKLDKIVGFLQQARADGMLMAITAPKEEVRALANKLIRRADINTRG